MVETIRKWNDVFLQRENVILEGFHLWRSGLLWLCDSCYLVQEFGLTPPKMFVCESHSTGLATVPWNRRRPLGDRTSIIGICPEFSKWIKIQLPNKGSKFGVFEIERKDILKSDDQWVKTRKIMRNHTNRHVRQYCIRIETNVDCWIYTNWTYLGKRIDVSNDERLPIGGPWSYWWITLFDHVKGFCIG